MYPSHSNYMNGVPVKISEKYKPPKKLSLSQGLSQRLTNSDSTVQLLGANYEFNLERNVLAKIAEWQQMRRKESSDRRERSQARQEETQKQLEQRQKQLLTAVSYPSAEELSSDDEAAEDQKTVTNLNRINAAMRMTTISAASDRPVQQVPFSPPSYYDKILEPTVMAYHQHSRKKSVGKTPNYCKINYSDFENDTSSPFDNVELKTINDLDILAQVLNKTANITAESTEDVEVTNKTSLENHQQGNISCSYNQEPMTDNFVGGVIHQTQQSNPPIQQFYQHQGTSGTAVNAYYGYPLREQQMSPDTTMYQMTEYSNVTKVDRGWTPSSIAQPQNHIHHNLNQFHQPTGQGQGQYVPSTNMASNVFQPPTTTAAFYDQHVTTGMQTKLVFSATQQSAPPSNWSKSKSVPDILKELNDELQTSEVKRVRKNSQSSTRAGIDSNANKNQNLDKSPGEGTARAVAMKDTNNSPRKFSQLSSSSQKLATNVSSMGFPMERVARITAKIGNDEKKVIEHLISISELLDLGFDENKISDALLRFNNNKDKALDFLIS